MPDPLVILRRSRSDACDCPCHRGQVASHVGPCCCERFEELRWRPRRARIEVDALHAARLDVFDVDIEG